MDLACLNQLMAYVLLNMPFTELAVPVDLLLTQLEDLKSSEVEPKSQEALGGYLRGVRRDMHWVPLRGACWVVSSTIEMADERSFRHRNMC
jgi:hypothetical protein